MWNLWATFEFCTHTQFQSSGTQQFVYDVACLMLCQPSIDWFKFKIFESNLVLVAVLSVLANIPCAQFAYIRLVWMNGLSGLQPFVCHRCERLTVPLTVAPTTTTADTK